MIKWPLTCSFKIICCYCCKFSFFSIVSFKGPGKEMSTVSLKKTQKITQIIVHTVTICPTINHEPLFWVWWFVLPMILNQDLSSWFIFDVAARKSDYPIFSNVVFCRGGNGLGWSDRFEPVRHLFYSKLDMNFWSSNFYTFKWADSY